MARTWDSTNSNTATVASVPSGFSTTTNAVTFAVWFKPNSVVGNGPCLVEFVNTGATHWLILQWRDDVSGRMTLNSNDGTARSTFSSNGVISSGSWHHACCSFSQSAGTGTGTAYLDGTGSTPSSFGYTAITDLTYTQVGGHKGSGTSFTPKADMAECGIWNVVLTDSEVAALANGVDLKLVRPGNIIAYYPFWGLASPEPDMSGGVANLTLSGSPFLQANHAPITLWTPKAYSFPQPLVIASDVLIGRQQLRFM